LIVAAEDAGCQILFSEDFQHGQKFGTLTVENPFRREAD
jgi:predicted nucleic acid-binding protein